MKLKNLIFLAIVPGMIACSSENDDPTPVPTTPSSISIADLTLAIDENPTQGRLLGSIIATGADNITFSLTSESHAGAFVLNTTSGQLSVGDETLYDFETNPQLTAVFTAMSGELSESANLTVSLNDLQEVTITTSDFEATIDENPQAGYVFGNINGEASSGTISFSLISESLSGAFSIDSGSGELSVADVEAFNFEIESSVTAVIKVEASGASKEANVTITIDDVFIETETGALAYYTFDGNADNALGTGYNGTVNGAALQGNDRKNATGSSYEFDGNASVVFGDLPLTTESFTIGFWIYQPSFGGQRNYRILSLRETCTTGNFLDLSYMNSNGAEAADRISAEMRSDHVASDFSGSAAADNLPKDQWVHVTVIKDNSTKTTRIYFNGTQIIETEWSRTDLDLSIENSASLTIANSPCIDGFNTRRFIGSFDDMAIFNRALSDTEVNKLAQ